MPKSPDLFSFFFFNVAFTSNEMPLSLNRFAYSELLKLARGEESFVFATTSSPQFECHLKPGLRLHLFSSHTPCGDASIFPKDDSESAATVIDDSNNGGVPAKRVKLDSGDIYRQVANLIDSFISGINTLTLHLGCEVRRSRGLQFNLDNRRIFNVRRDVGTWAFLLFV